MYEFQLSGKLPYHVELITLAAGHDKTVSLKFPAIVFVTATDLIIRFAGENDRLIEKGQLFLLPKSVACVFKVESQSEIIIMEIPNITALYVFFINSKSAFKRSEISLFFPLTMDTPILRIVDSLQQYMRKGFVDTVLAGLKALELFYNLERSYSKEELDRFFSPIRTDDCAFAIFVLMNHTKVKTAEELAELSNYSLSGFNKQFHKTFGMAPYKWMLQWKIDRIYKELYYETSKPIKLISEEYGFTNLSNLGDFCRKHLGASPTVIRNRTKLIK